MDLGALENIELRDIWQTEASDFTPWLASETNIALLGQAINMSLEVEGTEKEVGPFRADIICKDLDTNQWVLVENQLEKTDHTHLGQLLTYASGLNAVTIIWIAKQFTDEHRSALDWLNDITDERFRFFGIEIELWKIGNSLPAPHFKIISKLNDWTKSVVKGARSVDANALTPAKKMQLEYWTQLRDHLQTHSKIIRPQKALPQHWTNFAIGRSHFHLSASVNSQEKLITVNLNLTGTDSKMHFHLLLVQKEALESQLGFKLHWDEKPEGIESWIFIRQPADPWDEIDQIGRAHV